MRLIAAARAPIMNDISTDLADPPKFSAARPGRGVPRDYPMRQAEKQRAAYPGVKPLMLAMPVPRAFGIALEAAKQMGWELVAAERDEGRIEAVATTRIFRFKDDVVIRLTAEEGGTRLDMRSKSRVGKGDLGKNAARIRDYFAAVKRLAR